MGKTNFASMRIKNQRQNLIAKNPYCYFCQKKVTFEDSGLFRFSNKNPYNRENGIHIGEPSKVLACLDCIYKKRYPIQSGNSKNQKKREKLLKKDAHCYYCKCNVTLETSTLDHLVPRAKGGKNSLDNLVLCCYVCNHKKGTRTAEEFLKFLAEEKKNGFT